MDPKYISYERKYEGSSIEVNSFQSPGGSGFILQAGPQDIDISVIKQDPLNDDLEFKVSGFMPVVTATPSHQL